MWTIRRADQEDRHSVMALWRTVGLEMADDAEWRALTRGLSANLLVAEENGHLLGTAVASYDGWRAFVSHVAVERNARGRGIARGLMEEAERRLHQLGAHRIYALVNGNNTAGLGVLAVSGFEPGGDMAFVKEMTPVRSLPAISR